MSGWLKRLFGQEPEAPPPVAIPAKLTPSAAPPPSKADEPTPTAIKIARPPEPVETVIVQIELENTDLFGDDAQNMIRGTAVAIVDTGDRHPQGLVVIELDSEELVGTIPRSGALWDAYGEEYAKRLRLEALVSEVDHAENPVRVKIATLLPSTFVSVLQGTESLTISGSGPLDRAHAAKRYAVGIVGEAKYQREISACKIGDTVIVFHEPDNPYDENALAIVSSAGSTIGYISRDHWLQGAIHEEGKGCAATIKTIAPGSSGKLGVVLDVTLNREPIPKRAFTRAT